MEGARKQTNQSLRRAKRRSSPVPNPRVVHGIASDHATPRNAPEIQRPVAVTGCLSMVTYGFIEVAEWLGNPSRENGC